MTLFVRRKYLLVFVDDEGARGTILKGRSGNGTLSSTVRSVPPLEEELGSVGWCSRAKQQQSSRRSGKV